MTGLSVVTLTVHHEGSPHKSCLLPALRNVQVEQSQMAITRKKAVAMVKMIPVMTWNATKALVLFLWEIIKNPRVMKDKLGEAQYHLKEVCWRSARAQYDTRSRSGTTVWRF